MHMHILLLFLNFQSFPPVFATAGLALRKQHWFQLQLLTITVNLLIGTVNSAPNPPTPSSGNVLPFRLQYYYCRQTGRNEKNEEEKKKLVLSTAALKGKA